MIVKLNPQTREDELDKLTLTLKQMELDVTLLPHTKGITLELHGIVTDDKLELITRLPKVIKTEKIQSPYKKASKQLHPDPSVIEVGNIKIGGGHFAMIGGPCSIEDKDQLEKTAEYVKEAGGNMLRGGAFKPRTSPYSFQGLGKSGLDIMSSVGQKLDMPIVSEVMSIEIGRAHV